MNEYYDQNAVLTSERLTLRPLREDDASAIFHNIYHDREVLRYYLAPYKENEAEVDLRGMIERTRRNGIYVFAIALKETGETIGLINEFGNRDSSHDCVELGYAIGSGYWNQGYGTEALRETCRFLFGKGVRKIRCGTIKENTRSIRVMQKSGMKWEKSEPGAIIHQDRYWDVEYYYMTKEMINTKPKIKAVLFDYNGTLFIDDDINRICWKQTFDELSEGKMDTDAFLDACIGARNQPMVEKAFIELGLPLDEEKIMYWARRKETRYYQEYCRTHERNTLVNGAAEFIEYLQKKGIPYNLCTASLIENVRFYFGYLGLGQWFDMDKVIYDDGHHADKKEMYLSGAASLGVPISDCLVIDDSAGSIRGAIEAGCRHIVAIRKKDTPKLPEIIQVVDDFSEIDLSILES